MKQPKTTKRWITSIEGHTCVGSFGTYPRHHGNCFTAKLRRYPKSVRILNMIMENIEYLVKIKVLSWPIQVDHIDGTPYALINDERIPSEYYYISLDGGHCPVCTPWKYQTPAWRKQWAAKIKSGEVKISKAKDGMRVIRRRLQPSDKAPKSLPFKVTLVANKTYGIPSDVAVKGTDIIDATKE